ncbi:hypothetical protein T11_18090 [Trichinella zimbabwensis]|uniref:Uncharacterized protein n=1 Tax=Trichinella zimbabwensis TaxID=268475 RepID=A0A0V1H322_9BILA|nr:hypothetical protein T11_18090 [Trichinella zimbabwensis]
MITPISWFTFASTDILLHNSCTFLQNDSAFHWCQLFEALVFCLNRKQIDRSLLIEKEGPLRLLGLLGQWESITTTTTKALYINLFTHCCVFTDVRNRLNPACDISRSPSVSLKTALSICCKALFHLNLSMNAPFSTLFKQLQLSVVVGHQLLEKCKILMNWAKNRPVINTKPINW